MANISPKQFGPPTKSVPMPTKPPGGGFKPSGMRSVPMPTKPPGGSFGRVGPTPVPMPTKPPGMKGMIGGTNRSVPMPTKPPSGGFKPKVLGP